MLGRCVFDFVMKDSLFGTLRQVRSDRKDKNAVVSFTLTDEPQHIDLLKSDSKEEVSVRLRLRTATQDLIWWKTPQLCQDNWPFFLKDC